MTKGRNKIKKGVENDPILATFLARPDNKSRNGKGGKAGPSPKKANKLDSQASDDEEVYQDSDTELEIPPTMNEGLNEAVGQAGEEEKIGEALEAASQTLGDEDSHRSLGI